MPITPELHQRLQNFWKSHRNPHWLFPATGRGWKQSGIKKTEAMGRAEVRSGHVVTEVAELVTAEVRDKVCAMVGFGIVKSLRTKLADALAEQRFEVGIYGARHESLVRIVDSPTVCAEKELPGKLFPNIIGYSCAGICGEFGLFAKTWNGNQLHLLAKAAAPEVW